MAIANGFLDSTDPLNPTRFNNRFRDDYLLRGITSGSVTVDLTSSTSGNRIDPYLQIINADTGEVVAFNDDGGTGLNSRLTFTAERGVNYALRATSFGFRDTGSYTISTNVGTIGLGGTPITGDQTFSGTLVNTDPDNPNRTGSFRDDYFLTGVETGQLVTVNLTSPTSGAADTRIDPFLQVLNADTGAVVAFNDDGGTGLNSRLSFTVGANTDYVIRATSFSSGDVGAYTLSTSTSSFSLDGTLAETDPSNPTRSGTFRDDYFLTGVNPGQQVQLDLNSPTGAGNFDTFIQLVNADTGAVITSNDDGGPGLNSRLNFTAQEGIDYIARVTSFASGATGDYSLTSSVGVLYEGVPLSPGGQIVGTLDNTDLNNDLRNGSFYDGYYLEDLVAGMPVTLNLNSPSFPDPNNFDTYLQVVNGSTGDLIALNDDGGPGLNSQLTFTPQQGVEYIARVTSFASGATGDYTLTIAQRRKAKKKQFILSSNFFSQSLIALTKER